MKKKKKKGNETNKFPISQTKIETESESKRESIALYEAAADKGNNLGKLVTWIQFFWGKQSTTTTAAKGEDPEELSPFKPHKAFKKRSWSFKVKEKSDLSFFRDQHLQDQDKDNKS